MEMDKEEAIDYLQKKDKIRSGKTVQPTFTKKEQEKIKDVMKRGKIYGDPLVVLN